MCECGCRFNAIYPIYVTLNLCEERSSISLPNVTITEPDPETGRWKYPFMLKCVFLSEK